MTRQLILKALDGQPLRASEREMVGRYLDHLESAALASETMARAGAVRSQTIRALVVDGDLIVDTGTVRVGPVAANQGNILLSSGGIKLRTNTTVKIDLQTDGDIFIGENTAAAATTNIAIFTAAQTYNSESMAAGDMLIGDNSSSKANILWDKSAGQLLFRGGTTTTTSIDTNGLFNFANGRNLRWENAAGTPDKAEIGLNSSDNISIFNLSAGKSIGLFATMTDAGTPGFVFDEDSGEANRSLAQVQSGSGGAKFQVLGPTGATRFEIRTNTWASGGETAFLWTPANYAGLTASTERVNVDFDIDHTVEFATGALTTQRHFLIRNPTFAFVGASTLTNAATLAIAGAPVAGTNATITNAYALWVQGGKTQLDGEVRTSDKLRLGSVTTAGFKQATATVADDATVQIFATNDQGWVFVCDNTNVAAIYQIDGSNNTVTEIADTATAYATTNTDGLTSIEATGSGVYTLRNRRGASRTYTMTLIGQF